METYEAFQLSSLECLLIRFQIILNGLRLQAHQTGNLAQKRRSFGDLEHVHAMIINPEKVLSATLLGEQLRKDEIAIRL